MKKTRRLIATSLIIISMFFSNTLVGYSYTADSKLLQDAVDKNVKTGQITYASLYDIDKVSRADLQSAAARANKKGGKVFFQFNTLNDKAVVARITMNPNQVKSKEGNLNFTLNLDPKTNKDMIDKAEKKFGRKVAVIQSPEAQYGMNVVISAKIDLGKIKKDNLVAYSYNKDTDTYTSMANAKCSVDDNGFLHFQTNLGGSLVITDTD